jgi:hypothetical protein
MLTPAECAVTELAFVFLLWSQGGFPHGGRGGCRGQYGHTCDGHLGRWNGDVDGVEVVDDGSLSYTLSLSALSLSLSLSSLCSIPSCFLHRSMVEIV